MTDLKLLATQALADRAEHTSQSGTVWRDEHYERAVFEREPALARGYLELEAEVVRLTGCLKRANAGTEHFEQAWNLAQDERDEARTALSDATAANLAFNVKAAREINEARAEVTRLTGCLKRDNEHVEHFERLWYLVQHERDDARAALRTACELLNGYIPDPPRHPTHAQDRADIAVLRTRGGV